MVRFFKPAASWVQLGVGNDCMAYNSPLVVLKCIFECIEHMLTRSAYEICLTYNCLYSNTSPLLTWTVVHVMIAVMLNDSASGLAELPVEAI